MACILNATIFKVIEPPHIVISKPKWMQLPSPMQTFTMILISYLFVTGGVIYDIINEVPSVGSVVDERGHHRPQAIMVNRLNGQYIMEGLASAFMFTLGGVGMIVMDKCNAPQLSRRNRVILIAIGFIFMCASMFCLRMFMNIKMPYYLR